MQTFLFSEEWLIRTFLIFIRTSSIFISAPFFGQALIPLPVRIILSLGISYCLSGVVPVTAGPFDSLGTLASAVLAQVGAGLILGFVAQIVFAGIQVAGQVVGTQAGFSLINIIDPQTAVENPLIAVYLNSLALTLFLALDGHHILLRALAQSFAMNAATFQSSAPSFWLSLVHQTGRLFVIALQVVAPLFGLMIITDALLGLAGKIAPQIPILIIGFPLKLLMGIMGLSLCLYLFPTSLEKHFLEQMAWFQNWVFGR